MNLSKLTKKLSAAVLAAIISCPLGLLSPSYAASEYDASGATTFVFSDSEITASEGKYSGYSIDSNKLTIDDSGVYVLSGTSEDASVTVKGGVTDVTLVLSSLSLKSSDTAPILCKKSSEVKIIAERGTENSLCDSEKNNSDNYPENEDAENAVIKGKDASKLTLCGGGTLSITALGKNGIKSGASTDEDGEAYLIIDELTLNVTASVNDAINAEASITVLGGKLVLDAGDDAIHSDYKLTVGKEGGEGPVIDIKNAYEGLEAANVLILSGDITVNTSDDCINGANSDLGNYQFSITIAGGNISAYTSEGDGIDSNGSITISGGSIEVWSANVADNQPLDADGTITITGGTVFAAGGSGGMGMTLNASQPYLRIGSTMMGGFGMNKDMPRGDVSGEVPDMPRGDFSGEVPDMPQGDFSGEVPDMPQGDFSGEVPDMSRGDFSGEVPDMPQGDFSGEVPDMPRGDVSGEVPDMPQGGFDVGNTDERISISSGSKIEITSADGNAVYSTTAPCNASFVFFTSASLIADNSYALSANGETVTELAATSGSVSQTPSVSDHGSTANGGAEKTYALVLIVLICVIIAVCVVIVIIRLKKRKTAETPPDSDDIG